MVRAAGRAGWIDERRVTMEILTSIRRAGANQIITYHAGRRALVARRERLVGSASANPGVPVGDDALRKAYNHVGNRRATRNGGGWQQEVACSST